MIDGAINQNPVWPMTRLKPAADEVLLAVADRGSTSNVSRRASRTVLEEFTRALREYPEWLRGGFIANGHL